MRKIFYSVSTLLIIVAMGSCRKNMDHESRQVVIDTTLASGTEYVLDLKSFGDADDVATIIKQASNFSTSEITNTAGTFSPVYHYSAISKTSTSDQVVLSITEGNRGGGNCRHHNDSTNITINFLVK